LEFRGDFGWISWAMRDFLEMFGEMFGGFGVIAW